MKFTKVLAAAALSLALATGCTIGNGIITVNGDTITKADYDKAYNVAASSPQYAMLGGDSLKDPESMFSLIIRDRVINELIVRKLLDQEVTKMGIKVTNEDVKTKKEEIAAQMGGMEALKERLKAAGVSEKDLDKDIKEEVKVNKLVEATGNISVSEKEIKDFYNGNKDKFKHPDQVRASHILITVDPNAIKQSVIDEDKKGELNAAQIDEKVKAKIAELKAKAQEIRAKAAKNPADFAKLAKEFSQDPGSQKQGGDLGFFSKGQMVPEFEKVAFKITPNSVSEIIETQFGYHIIIVTDRAKAGVTSLEKATPEIKAYLEQQKKVTALQKLFDGLKANAKIEYTDENFNPEKIQEKIQALVKVQQTQQPQEAPAKK